jgi:hypothetical protein
MMKLLNNKTWYIRLAFFAAALSFLPSVTEAAILRVSPNTGVYTVGNTFTVQVIMNTQGAAVNASDAVLSFNPRELSVVSVNRSSSVFNLWTQEPTYSNTAGTISFGGGLPSGYTGSQGSILTISFRALVAGTPKVSFSSGSVLAADGLGTNVLSQMNGGAYTISAKSDLPPPEYVPPASTPDTPKVTSSTHEDANKWYKDTTARLMWPLPNDVTAVRTLLDRSPNTVPTIVYESPLREREITDLPEGTSYFHIQFKNEDGWGRITHYALNVDTESPSLFTIREDNPDTTKPTRTLIFEVEDTSPVRTFNVQINGGDFVTFTDTEGSKKYTLEFLDPGEHTVVVEAVDSVGLKRVSSYTLIVEAFEAPVLTEYPQRLTTGVIPALRGTTRPNAKVTLEFREGDRVFGTYEGESNGEGVFTIIPDTPLPIGVYEVTGVATDQSGARSLESIPFEIIVEEPGYIRIGSFMVGLLSIVVPLIALSILLFFGTSVLIIRMRIWRKRVMTETLDAETKLAAEFDALVSTVHEKVIEMKEARKSKLTKSEIAQFDEIETSLRGAQSRIRKELTDIEHIVE